MQSTRRDLAHQKRTYDNAMTRLQTRIDDLPAQVTKLVCTLDRKCATDANPGAVDTRI